MCFSNPYAAVIICGIRCAQTGHWEIQAATFLSDVRQPEVSFFVF